MEVIAGRWCKLCKSESLKCSFKPILTLELGQMPILLKSVANKLLSSMEAIPLARHIYENTMTFTVNFVKKMA